MKKIITIVEPCSNTETFDMRVNAALENGYKLLKRTLVPIHTDILFEIRDTARTVTVTSSEAAYITETTNKTDSCSWSDKALLYAELEYKETIE